ncbi:Hypothetical_protein [Hexamita inflata]|uniref:Hypothetical_protein n=1 Tax=Hexamita inflata TaxID=28002 RepID=A0AA86PCJ2_9EUKA|nr:Hypothetical protein HINF_LOCUS24124 [Hexamita inflata]
MKSLTPAAQCTFESFMGMFKRIMSGNIIASQYQKQSNFSTKEDEIVLISVSIEYADHLEYTLVLLGIKPGKAIVKQAQLLISVKKQVISLQHVLQGVLTKSVAQLKSKCYINSDTELIPVSCISFTNLKSGCAIKVNVADFVQSKGTWQPLSTPSIFMLEESLSAEINGQTIQSIRLYLSIFISETESSTKVFELEKLN